jgi:hypothetical protein
MVTSTTAAAYLCPLTVASGMPRNSRLPLAASASPNEPNVQSANFGMPPDPAHRISGVPDGAPEVARSKTPTRANRDSPLEML